MRIRFGDFELNSATAELTREGEVVHLQPLLLRLLEHLISERHRVVTHEELLRAIWPSETVVPGVVTSAIRALRRALGDDPSGASYIRTTHRRGYRFVAEVGDVSGGRSASHWPIVLARHAAFVGRQQELALCYRTVVNPESQVQLVFVHGPPGIGKTSFLHELAFQCREQNVSVARLDAEYLAPYPDSFAQALSIAPRAEGNAQTSDEFPGSSLRLFLIDNYERVSALDAWLREIFLPELRGSHRLVLASRAAPRSRWRSDPAWQQVVQAIELGPLDRADSARLLRVRDATMQERTIEACWSYSKGHPLALALSAESLSTRPNLDGMEGRTDIVDALVERFADTITEPRHKQALEAASFVEEVDERFLAAMLEPSSSEGLMKWLSNQAFARRVRGGVSVHTLAREAVIAQLRWRDPERLQQLVERGMRCLAAELGRAGEREAGLRWSRRLMSVARHHPVMRPYFRDEEAQELELRRAVRGARNELPSLVERHEGREAADVARRWLDRQPQEVWIVADEQPVPAGFVQLLLLGPNDRDAATWDPVVDAIFRHVDSLGGLAEDEIITVHRFVVGRDSYQEISPVMQRCHEVVNYTHHWYPAGHARVAHSYTVYGQMDIWEAVGAFSDFAPLKGYETPLGKRIFGVIHHSFRDCPFDAWAASIIERMTSARLPA